MTRSPQPLLDSAHVATTANYGAAATTHSVPTTTAQTLASVLVGLMPLSLAMHGPVKIVVPALLFFSGLYLLATRQDIRAAFRRILPVTACAALVIAFAIVNALIHGLGLSALDRAAHVLMYLSIAAVFASGLRMRIVWAGFSMTAIAFGLFCIVQHFVIGIDRATSLNGDTSTSIEFATLMIGLALLALVRLLSTRRMPWERCLHVAAFALGIYGTLLTQSRGPLLAFIPLFLGLLLLKWRLSGQWRDSLIWLGLFVAIGAVALTTLHGATIQRFDGIDEQLQLIRDGAVDGSLSARVEMWRTAVQAIAAHPLAGLGLGNFDAYIDAQIMAGNADPGIAPYNNPHNMYLGAAANGGIPGLLVLLGMFVLPLIVFCRHLRDSDDKSATAAWAGITIVALYMLCGLTDSVFYRIMSQSFYYLLVLGLTMVIARRAVARDTPTAPGAITMHLPRPRTSATSARAPGSNAHEPVPGGVMASMEALPPERRHKRGYPTSPCTPNRAAAPTTPPRRSAHRP